MLLLKIGPIFENLGPAAWWPPLQLFYILLDVLCLCMLPYSEILFFSHFIWFNILNLLQLAPIFNVPSPELDLGNFDNVKNIFF